MSDKFQDFLEAADDFLIDRVAQPICDTVRKTTGWSKRIPIAVALILIAIGLAAYAFAFFKTPAYPLFHVLFKLIGMFLSSLALVVIATACAQILAEFFTATNTRPSSTMAKERLTKKPGRLQTLVTQPILLLAGILLLISLSGTIENALGILCYPIGMILSNYFHACTDLPPGKSLFAKTKEFLGELWVRPRQTTS